MAVFYREGETKVRPGLYMRYSNVGHSTLVGARDGICAIPVRATWGPVGKVLRNTATSELTKNYGSGDYSAINTVPAALALFEGGASTVYTYRLGTGGTAASVDVTEGLTATAIYPGTMPLAVSVQAKLGDTAFKEFIVYSGATQLEVFEFPAGESGEGEALIAATAGSKYVTLTAETPPATVPVLAVASGALTGGVDPTVTNADYSAAFAAFEPYYYNTITLDVDDDENVTLSLLLQAYLANAHKLGKLGIAVVGEKSTVDFADRCTHARAFNDEKVVYLGGGYMVGEENRDGVLAICYTAGLIAGTPANQAITRAVIRGATDLCETLTYQQYVDAINAGMLLLSMSPDGNVWYDSGINTLTMPDGAIQDDGWKKIRRTKTRFEMFDRLDRVLEPKIGRVTPDNDGIADVLQTAGRILDAMVAERKLHTGASFVVDPARPPEADSAWFVIDADDYDSLEKIYEHFRFRFSAAS